MGKKRNLSSSLLLQKALHHKGGAISSFFLKSRCRRLCWIPCRHAFASGERLRRPSTDCNGITHTLLRRDAMSEQSSPTCTLPRPFFMSLALSLKNDAHLDHRNTPRIEHFFYGSALNGSSFALLCFALHREASDHLHMGAPALRAERPPHLGSRCSSWRRKASFSMTDSSCASANNKFQNLLCYFCRFHANDWKFLTSLQRIR